MSCPFKNLYAAQTSSDTNIGTCNKLITFMQGSEDAGFLLDKEGAVIYSNKAAKLLFLSNVDRRSFCSLFSFTNQANTDCWDELASTMHTNVPDHHEVIVEEEDGTKLGFRVNFVKLSSGMVGHVEGNEDAFACAYVIPAPVHDKEDSFSNTNADMYKHSVVPDARLQSHMREVVEASLDPMFSVFESGIVWMANDAAVKLFGYSNSELNERNISEICFAARSEQKAIHGSQYLSVKNHRATAVNRFGMDIPVELSIRLMTSFDGTGEKVYFIYMKDLSILEEYKAQIQHKDTLCQAMINASFDPMFGIDQRGKIIVTNDAATNMFGYTKEEFIDHNISMICPPRDAKDHDKHLARYIRTGERRVIGRKRNLVARRKDGSEFHIELGVSEVMLSPGEKMFCGFVRDITQQKLDKQMLRRSEAIMSEKFFQQSPEESKDVVKKYPARYTVN